MALAVAAKFKMRYSLNDHSLAARVYRDGIYYFAINLCESSSYIDVKCDIDACSISALSITSIVLYNELQGPLKEVSAMSVFKISVVSEILKKKKTVLAQS
jgi:hypothetical protein